MLEGTVLDSAALTDALLPNGYPSPEANPPEAQESYLPLDATSDATPRDLSLSPPVQEAAPSTVPRSCTPRQSPLQLSWAPLLFWWLGFSTLGYLLALQQAKLPSYLLALIGSILWVFDDSLTAFVPIVAAIAGFSPTDFSRHPRRVRAGNP
ncbi:MAG: hypothetical protein NZ772_09710 [Cyanobacteria bacterium]|nr:hypothetical protein [Cyanobacteriota bacterium]MDW8201768.1 hypothetical protein [Cyanobacteriota bacterium SKYGB_h_bin112]